MYTPVINMLKKEEQKEKKVLCCNCSRCNNGVVRCKSCHHSLCDICFDKGKGRVIWSDNELCGMCDERGDEPEDGDDE